MHLLPQLFRAPHAYVQGLKAKEVAVHPQPLSPSFFSERIDGIDAKVSKKLYDALKHALLLDNDGLLRYDPRCATPVHFLLCAIRAMRVQIGDLIVQCQQVIFATIRSRCWFAATELVGSPRRAE